MIVAVKRSDNDVFDREMVLFNIFRDFFTSISKIGAFANDFARKIIRMFDGEKIFESLFVFVTNKSSPTNCV